jgi:hypothetical protein
MEDKMAVSLKTSPDHGYDVLKWFGVDPGLITKSQSHGLLINNVKPGIIEFSITPATGAINIMATIPIKETAIYLASQGKLGPASLAAINATLETNLVAALVKLGVNSNTAEKKTIFHDAITGEFFKSSEFENSALKTKVEVNPAPAPVEGGTIQTNNPTIGSLSLDVIKQLMSKARKPVHLANADHCYQPVHGTSKGSVYYVGAMFIGMKMAVRIQSNSFSVRVEGDCIKNFNEGLLELGLTDHGTYYSAHYNISKLDLVCKTYGAILASLGFSQLNNTIDIIQFIQASEGIKSV